MGETPQRPSEDAADDNAADRTDLDETPPLLGSWRNIYVLVVASQVVLVALFYLVTRIYA